MAPCFLLRFLVICYFSLILFAKSPIKNYGGCPLDYYNCGEFGNSDIYNTRCGLNIRGCDKPRGEEVQLGNGKWYEIIAADLPNEPYSIIVQDKELQEPLLSTICNASFNYDIPSLPRFTILPLEIANIIILYKCNRTPNLKLPFSFLNHSCPDHDIHYNPSQDDDNLYDSFNSCSKIHLPVDPTFLQDQYLDPFYFLSSKLHIQVNLPEECVRCYKTADVCTPDNGRFHCRKDFRDNKIGGALISATKVVFAIGVLLFFVLSYYRFDLAPLWKNISKAHHDFEAFLKCHGPLAAKRYSYSEIKKITNSFKEKLGQGGYGDVYKGKLYNGCRVAVKILSESKGNGEEFLNEVASFSRTSHVNIVTLLGFCYEGSKRALVYEFMPNGSLEKFIYENNPSMNNHQLDIEILYQIAIGVARGLEYLHRGCNTRIFHFDIKPHNILLDENFCPKISDFGLAKICLKKESIVSMQGARGTIGYIAPEVFNRNFGEVSHKSDIYSYGMMVLEIVGAKKNINVKVDHTSEIYFPDWIYKCLELNEEFALRSIRNDIDKDRTKKMLIVSLWCIQTNPRDRPTIGRVVEMLEGRVENLQIPPKPFLSSPQRSPPTYSTH